MLKTTLLLFFSFVYIYTFGQIPESNRVDSLFINWNGPNTPGGAVGVIKDGKLAYAKGYGTSDLEHDIPITPTSVFYLASISKQFTAFCILLLEEQGKLNLDDEIQTFLPDFPKYESAITIRHLIHHTSGLRDFSTLMDLQGKNYLDHISEKEVYELIKRQKSLNFPPGQEYLYNNSGYFLLGLIIKKVSGKSLKDFAAENIFLPLGMNNTTFLDDNRQIIKNRVFSYEKNEDKTGFNNVIRRYDIVGSGGVYSNIEDLVLWDQNFYDNKLGKGGQEIINKMHQEYKTANGSSSGYAFGIVNGSYKGVKRVGHGGSNASFRTHMSRFPDQHLTIIVLANRSDVNATAKLYEVADIFLKDKIDPVQNQPSQKDIPKMQSNEDSTFNMAELNNFKGRYYSRELNTFYEVKIQNDHLLLLVNDVEISPLSKIAENTLSNKDFGVLHFEKNKYNKITGFQLSIQRIKKLYFSKL